MSLKTEQLSEEELSVVKSGEPLLADTFPSKAFLVIDFCEKNEPNVAGWSDDGTTIIVKNPQTFALSHLPRYFKHSNFASFVRQLNIYGWQKVKDHDSSDGSVAFYHDLFQRGRPDLLGDIKRSYKKPPKKHSIQEEKKEDHASFNTRFDEIQQQMDTLAEKLDLLISIVTSSNHNGAFVMGKRKLHTGGKRRRHDFDDGRESPVSDVTGPTDPTAVSKGSSSSSISSTDSSPVAAVKVVPRFMLDMDVVDEEIEDFESAVGRDPRELYRDLLELRASTRELDENYHLHHSAPPEGVASMNEEEEENDDDDFKKYIDKMLEGNGQDSAMQCEQDGQEAVGDHHSDTPVDSTTFFSGHLMSKSNPGAVHSHVQIPQSMASAVVVSHREDGEYDEEAGDFASSPPLTTAVAVEDASVERKRFSRRSKIFIAFFAFMVLVALIVWPVVNVMDEKRETSSVSHPLRSEDSSGREPERQSGSGSGRKPERRSGGGSGPRPGGSGSGSGGWRDNNTAKRNGGWSSVDSSRNNVFGDTGSDSTESPFDRAEDTGSFDPYAKSIQGDSLSLAWQGGSYECVAVQPTP
jgi:hypothetical protein